MPGRLVHVEAITRSDFARDLDAGAGIDAWHVVDNVGIRGIASRVQECPSNRRPYNTFTIRRSRDSGTKTEYEKRKQALESENGWLYPHLTVQAYITSKAEGTLRTVGVAKTRDVIDAITNWLATGKPRYTSVYVQRTSNATFYVVRWTADLMQYVFDAERQPTTEQLALL